MCEKPILAQFTVPSRNLSRRAKASDTSRNQHYRPYVSRCDFEIFCLQGTMLPIRQRLHCVNCIAVPYKSLSAEVKRRLRYIPKSTYACMTSTGTTVHFMSYRPNTI
jgi:hypothetical protein